MKSKKTQELYSQFFKRQITLAEIGEEGQKRLQETSVLIIGCGGLGGTIAVHLATSGIGKIHLVDFDKVDLTNLHRQVFFTLEDVDRPKSEVLAEAIKKRTSFTKVSFSEEPLLKNNAMPLVNQYDIVVDATDSLPTKYLLNDVCVLQNKPLVYGSLYKFDGYVSTFNLQLENGECSANLRDAFPEMNTDIPNCEQAGTLNAIVGLIATAQVNEVLKISTDVGNPLSDQLMIYNALQNSVLKMKLRNKYRKEEIQAIYNQENYMDVSCLGQKEEWQISPEELKAQLGDPAAESNLELIAVLPNLKLPFEVDRTIPIQEFKVDQIDVDSSKTYVMICQKGFNSYKATHMMREKFPYLKVLNLTGGIENY